MNRFRLLWVMLFLIASPTPGQAQRSTGSVTTVLHGRAAKHSYWLRAVQGRFRPARHKIGPVGRLGHLPLPQIDGHYQWSKVRFLKGGGIESSGSPKWYGTDGGFPRTEFYEFSVTVDGKRWRVPSRLYRDCYNPGIRVKPNQRLWAWLAKDGERLTVKMHASDGAGAYGVLWHLRRNGRHTRKIWFMV